MEENKISYDKSYAKQLDEKAIYKCLYDAWGIPNRKIRVWGRLVVNPQGNWAGIKLAKLISTNEAIEYPLPNSKELQSGVFLPPHEARTILNGKTSVFIICELQLASIKQRELKDNPFLLSIDPTSVELLTELPKIELDEIVALDHSTLISEHIYHHFLTSLEKETRVAEEESLNKIKLLEEEYQEIQDKLNSQVQDSDKKILNLKNEEDILNKKISELEREQNSVKESIEIEQQALNSVIEKKRQIEEDMSKKIELLKKYVQEKAGFLKDFEFIDDDVYRDISGERDSYQNSVDGLSFDEDFDSDYTKLTSYIQAHLREQGQFYSRHIIENFLTLIRTNDLIILAGDSGSGKTSLVQSFAQAVSGVSKIIPVKPNWTSSEDLLGYYNPLEKKYLATPFLEAILEASKNPETPYFICLDEMNLARVEYYFADFLSKLEERKQQPQIQLYSDDEAAHVLSELRGVVSIISSAKEKYNKNGIIDFVALMQDEQVSSEMRRAFGFSDKDSLIKYHGDVRRMLSGVIGIPSTITIPNNVRIIGAINIDETTHYLSPKIMDRAHIMKFKSPLLTDWAYIEKEIESYGFEDITKPVTLKVDELGVREPYPNFDPADDFCSLFINFNREHFHPLGIEFGMRTIRQGLNYSRLFSDVNKSKELALNNFLIHKVLPKFTFDGSKPIGNTNKITHIERVLLPEIENNLSGLVVSGEFSAIEALKELTEAAKANDDVVNYWA
ncbi:McrB family protein [Rheinheimera marina]|uniref:McrB family protein n=1 Tax=Rheinheimera marina TaxID=1774958 RepID=A0ABV9JS48_9GAMM